MVGKSLHSFTFPLQKNSIKIQMMTIANLDPAGLSAKKSFTAYLHHTSFLSHLETDYDTQLCTDAIMKN